MGFVVLDDDGRAWTVQPITCERPGCVCGLRFCRPSFLAPVEEREASNVPACWPDCPPEELRHHLRLAATRRLDGEAL